MICDAERAMDYMCEILKRWNVGLSEEKSQRRIDVPLCDREWFDDVRLAEF